MSTIMDNVTEKRKVPNVLRKILAVDAYLTDTFVKAVEKILTFRQLKTYYRALEISCHGILWIASWIASIWIFSSKRLYQMQVNFLLGIFIDILVIAIVKAIARRRRPTTNDDLLVIGPDKYSFPSGHASRSAYIVYFFTKLWPVHYILIPPLLVWSIAVCLSRVLSRKHFIIDIIFGIILGIAFGMFVGMIYLNEKTCFNLILSITDEKLEGGDYHV